MNPVMEMQSPERRMSMIKGLCRLLYLAFLILGIQAAYAGNMPVALFFAITCAGESIGMSIDYWPMLQKKKLDQALKG